MKTMKLEKGKRKINYLLALKKKKFRNRSFNLLTANLIIIMPDPISSIPPYTYTKLFIFFPFGQNASASSEG